MTLARGICRGGERLPVARAAGAVAAGSDVRLADRCALAVVDPTRARPAADTGGIGRPAPTRGRSANALRADNKAMMMMAKAARMMTSGFRTYP
jgi:hypothetical protein